MSRYRIRKGFDIPLAGKPEVRLEQVPEPVLVAVETREFPGIKPKVLVAEGDRVQTGQPVFFDKNDPDTRYVSPATGVVSKVELGARRFLRRVVIEPDQEDSFFAGPKLDAAGIGGVDRATVIGALKQAGLWPLIRQRPVGKIAQADQVPSAIYVNGMDTEPAAADPGFCVRGQRAEIQLGIDLLARLTEGPVRLCLRAGAHPEELSGLNGGEVHEFEGPHPAGLVGTHINCVAPLGGHEVVWYLKAQEVALLGHWLSTGEYPAQRVVALVGPSAPHHCYFRVRQGAVLPTLTGGRPLEGGLRIIDGTVLHGAAVEPTDYLGFYTWTVTVIDEGADRRDLFGWLLPQPNKLSASRAVWGWLKPKSEYDLDARLHGGHRGIVNIGSMESVLPLDIHPTYLLRAIQAGDLEEALNLGLLDVTEEDVALCTFVDPSKMDVGKVVREGLDLYEAEG